VEQHPAPRFLVPPAMPGWRQRPARGAKPKHRSGARPRVIRQGGDAARCPRDGAFIFGDLIGKLDVLAVACQKCGRAGRYPLQRLIDNRGRNAKVID
jgi:hypothetical protein